MSSKPPGLERISSAPSSSQPQRLFANNADFRFYRKPPIVDEVSASFLVPKSNMDSGFVYYITTWKSSFYGRVEKAGGAASSHDIALAMVSRELALLGIFNGQQDMGMKLPPLIAKHLLQMTESERKALAEAPDAQSVLIGVLAAAIGDMRDAGIGMLLGTATAALALVLPGDGIYSVAGIGDSAIYELGAGGVRRLLGPDTVNSEDQMAVEEYAFHRKVVFGKHITSKDMARENFVEALDESVASDIGVAREGGTILLVSAGVEKNLQIGVDAESGMVSDNSGCADIAAIMVDKAELVEFGEALASEIHTRMELVAGKPVVNGPFTMIPHESDATILALRLP